MPASCIFAHLAVADFDSRLRHQLAQTLPHEVDALDAVVQVENLPAAVQLAQDRRAHDLVLVRGDDRFDGQSLLRRGLDRAHVLRAGQAHVQRARDRRGGQREDVHQFPQMLEMFLVPHAEPLFLVDDHQPEVAELRVLLKQPVRADDDVHGPFVDSPDDFGLLGAGAEPAEHFDR